MYDDNDNQDHKSKSQIKREMLELQKLGEQLLTLKDQHLKQLHLSPELVQAIKLAKVLKSHGAKRRQLQYIGRLMRKVDPEPIRDYLAGISLQHQRSVALLHLYESWRERLLSEGSTAFSEFITQYPQADRQQLRQLILNAQKEISQQKSLGAAKALLRYIRSLDTHEE